MYSELVTNSTPDLKILSLKPNDVLSWALEPNPSTRLLFIKQDKAQ